MCALWTQGSYSAEHRKFTAEHRKPLQKTLEEENPLRKPLKETKPLEEPTESGRERERERAVTNTQTLHLQTRCAVDDRSRGQAATCPLHRACTIQPDDTSRRAGVKILPMHRDWIAATGRTATYLGGGLTQPDQVIVHVRNSLVQNFLWVLCARDCSRKALRGVTFVYQGNSEKR